jgi:hypothetical protein
METVTDPEVAMDTARGPGSIQNISGLEKETVKRGKTD